MSSITGKQRRAVRRDLDLHAADGLPALQDDHAILVTLGIADGPWAEHVRHQFRVDLVEVENLEIVQRHVSGKSRPHMQAGRGRDRKNSKTHSPHLIFPRRKALSAVAGNRYQEERSMVEA